MVNENAGNAYDCTVQINPGPNLLFNQHRSAYRVGPLWGIALPVIALFNFGTTVFFAAATQAAAATRRSAQEPCGKPACRRVGSIKSYQAVRGWRLAPYTGYRARKSE